MSAPVCHVCGGPQRAYYFVRKLPLDALDLWRDTGRAMTLWACATTPTHDVDPEYWSTVQAEYAEVDRGIWETHA